MPRLYHTKSRTGCTRCRTRRVKCDEARPACGSCARHNVPCLYERKTQGADVVTSGGDNRSPSSHLATSTSPATSSSTLAVGSGTTRSNSPSAETRDRRHRELGLLHLFAVEVSQTFPGTYMAENRRVWSVEVPKMALQYEPLLNGIFACTVLYKLCTGCHEPDVREELLILRANYFETTLQHHREALGSLDHHTADAASFTSVLLSIDAFANLRDRDLQCSGPYQPPVQWFQMSKGTMNVTRISLAIFREHPESMISALAKPVGFVEPSIIYCEANRAKFPRLLERRGAEMEDDRDHEAYMNAVSYLGSVLGAQESGEERKKIVQRLIIWPILVSSRYIELVEQRRPRALVILAHYFAMASAYSDVWYIGESPACEVRAIGPCIPPDWQDLMAWPLQMVQCPLPAAE